MDQGLVTEGKQFIQKAQNTILWIKFCVASTYLFITYYVLLLCIIGTETKCYISQGFYHMDCFYWVIYSEDCWGTQGYAADEPKLGDLLTSKMRQGRFNQNFQDAISRHKPTVKKWLSQVKAY